MAARGAWRAAATIAFGVVAGTAWGSALRAYMALLAGSMSEFDWAGTFVGIVLPGAVTGGLLAWAELLRRAGGPPRGRWLALAPLALAVLPLFVPGALVTLLTTGVGGGAPASAAFALIGGWAFSGRGSAVLRMLCGIVAAAVVAGVVLATPLVGGWTVELTRPKGALAAVLAASLFIVLAVASAIPHRIPGRQAA